MAPQGDLRSDCLELSTTMVGSYIPPPKLRRTQIGDIPAVPTSDPCCAQSPEGFIDALPVVSHVLNGLHQYTPCRLLVDESALRVTEFSYCSRHLPTEAKSLAPLSTEGDATRHRVEHILLEPVTAVPRPLGEDVSAR